MITKFSATISRALGSAPLTGTDLSASPTAPGLASRFVHGREFFLPHRNHYIPMEVPELVAAAFAPFLAGPIG